VKPLLLRLLLAACCGLVFFSSGAAAQTLADKVREATLANGLKLLVVERHDAPTFSAYLSIGVGGVDETSRTRGVAHLLEHMLFKGTRRIGTRDWAKEAPLLKKIEAVGSRIDELKDVPDVDPAELGALRRQLVALQAEHRKLVVKDEFSRIYAENGGVGYNAFTSKDMTTYVISLPANKLELWAALESDRMQNAVLREFYTERDVVMEERRRSTESNPDGMLYEKLVANAFSVHPYRNPTIGWESDISHLTLSETRQFLHSYYAPVNTTIALVGDIDFDRARALLERYFGGIPEGTKVPPVTAVEPPQRGEKRLRVEFDAEPQLAIAFHKPTLPDKADYVFDLIDEILSQGRNSRLYHALVVERQLATAVSTYSAPGSRYPNLFVIKAVPRYPHTAAEVEAAIYRELERLATEPVSADELEQARNRLRTDRLRYLQGNEGLARMLTYYQTVAGDWHYLVDYDAVVAGLDAEAVRRTAAAYLVPDNRTVAILGKSGGLE
jgi:predicted Zn-dependent peptidase